MFDIQLLAGVAPIVINIAYSAKIQWAKITFVVGQVNGRIHLLAHLILS
jgi:hypothetical protein